MLYQSRTISENHDFIKKYHKERGEKKIQNDYNVLRDSYIALQWDRSLSPCDSAPYHLTEHHHLTHHHH